MNEANRTFLLTEWETSALDIIAIMGDCLPALQSPTPAANCSFVALKNCTFESFYHKEKSSNYFRNDSSPPAPPFFNEYGNPGCVPRLGGDDTHDLSLPHNERFKYWGDWGEPSNRANAARVWTVVRLMTLAEDSGPGSTWFGKFDPAKTLCRLNCYFNDTFSLCFVGFSECKGCQNPKRNVFPVSELTGNISTIKAWFLKHRQIRRFQKMHLLPIWQTSKPLLLPFSCTERYKYPRHVTYV